EPKQGGQVSFGSEASAGGVPSARQAGHEGAFGGAEQPKGVIPQVVDIVTSKDRLALNEMRNAIRGAEEGTQQAPGAGVARATDFDLARLIDSRIRELKTGTFDPELSKIRATISPVPKTKTLAAPEVEAEPVQEWGKVKSGAPTPQGGAKLYMGLDPEEIKRVLRPAIRLMSGRLVVGEQGETHNDIIAKNKLDATQIDRRTFELNGKEFTNSREEAAPLAEAAGIKTETQPGRLHSTDLPDQTPYILNRILPGIREISTGEFAGGAIHAEALDELEQRLGRKVKDSDIEPGWVLPNGSFTVADSLELRKASNKAIESGVDVPERVGERKLQFSRDFTGSKLPPLIKGERLVTVQKPDGSTYQASFGDKYWKLGGKKIASIGRPVGDLWSHGMLAEGEKIVEQKQTLKGVKAPQRLGYGGWMNSSGEYYSVAPAEHAVFARENVGLLKTVEGEWPSELYDKMFGKGWVRIVHRPSSKVLLFEGSPTTKQMGALENIAIE